ncbi:rCG27859 [Rattus norvegicus]|uniref:RCG27859 n=1 Tax=Rattus norvegicus TaxID=10116 RepID=A6IFA3_RAT|nr:rCG27859 [Rattus norvegicus]
MENRLKNSCLQDKRTTMLAKCGKCGSPSYIVNIAAADISMDTFVRLKVKPLYGPTVLQATPAGLKGNIPQRNLHNHAFCCASHNC